MWLSSSLVSSIIGAIEMAEDKLGKPPSVNEIYVIFKWDFHHYEFDAGGFAHIVYNIFREDLLYADQSCYRFTARPRKGFYSFSDFFRKHYGAAGAYKIISDGRIWPASARTANLTDLLTMLKSKDETVFEKNKWLWEGNDFKFLDG